MSYSLRFLEKEKETKRTLETRNMIILDYVCGHICVYEADGNTSSRSGYGFLGGLLNIKL